MLQVRRTPALQCVLPGPAPTSEGVHADDDNASPQEECKRANISSPVLATTRKRLPPTCSPLPKSLKPSTLACPNCKSVLVVIGNGVASPRRRSTGKDPNMLRNLGLSLIREVLRYLSFWCPQESFKLPISEHVCSCMFSPADGQLLLTIGSQGTLKLWNAQGTLQHTLHDPTYTRPPPPREGSLRH